MSQADTVDVTRILQDHRAYFETGATKDINFRIRQLRALKDALHTYEPRIIEAMYADLHKSAYEAFTTEIGILYQAIGHATKHIRKWARPKRVGTPLTFFASGSRIYPEPYGTVLIIGPFNYPVNLIIEPLVGAIAAGNCAVIKPSPLAPNVSAVISEMMETTFEKQYIQVVDPNPAAESEIINVPFDYIFFTGSVPVGKIVMEAASRNLVPVTLELGGKSPCIIDETAGIKAAAKKIAWGKFSNAGQTCVAPDYLVVHRGIKEPLIRELRTCLTGFYGDSPRESEDFGRIINTRHTERLANLIDKEKVVIGGEYEIEACYVAPTVLDKVTWDDSIMTEELFGPLLPIVEYEDLDAVLRQINARPKPLALYLFSHNKTTQEKVIRSVSYGGGCINDVFIHLGNPQLPFGGVGSSGMGSYHGKASFTTFSHFKSVLKRHYTVPSDFMFPPYTGQKLNIIRKILR